MSSLFSRCQFLLLLRWFNSAKLSSKKPQSVLRFVSEVVHHSPLLIPDSSQDTVHTNRSIPFMQNDVPGDLSHFSLWPSRLDLLELFPRSVTSGW